MSCVVGLRVDVDTMRGLRVGVPALLALLAKHEVQASFFVSVGPDTMGRHVWRLLKPKFLWKMLRSNAAGLYGWDILCSGTLWPGVVMGRRQPDVIRAIGAAGHELGLHAWDHYRWQTRVARFSEDEAGREMQRGFDMLAGITGERPRVSAMPGWRCTEAAIAGGMRRSWRWWRGSLRAYNCR
jgi:undecaprenyl phosphate-alpha-L-ara4FN deformylase